jgi:putative ABC transport system permease protein
MGIYAMMSFAVAHRAREIGVRIALGAPPRSVLAAIFSRAVAQVGLGVLIGALVVSLAFADDPDARRIVAGVAAAMAAAGLIACILPAARALRVQPIEALRSD